jgi:hypothetical protein
LYDKIEFTDIHESNVLCCIFDAAMYYMFPISHTTDIRAFDLEKYTQMLTDTADKAGTAYREWLPFVMAIQHLSVRLKRSKLKFCLFVCGRKRWISLHARLVCVLG